MASASATYVLRITIDPSQCAAGAAAFARAGQNIISTATAINTAITGIGRAATASATATTSAAATAAAALQALAAAAKGVAAANAQVAQSTNQAQAAMRGGAQGANIFTSALKEVGQALKFIVIYGAIFKAAQLFSDAIKKATEYQTTLVHIRTLAGESAAQTREWNKDLIAMAPAVGVGPGDLAKAMYQITSTGQHGAEALRILRYSAEASAIGLGDTAVIARTVTGALNAYGAANLSAASATDTLVAMVKLGGGEADAFAGTLGRVLPVASAVGVSFQEVGSFMATFTRLGVSAAEAATAARGALGALELHNYAKGREELKKLGISYADLRKEITEKGFAQALVDIQHKFAGNEEGLQRLIPNIRALTGVLAVAKSQEQEYLAVNAEIQASLGHIRNEAFKLTEQNPGFVFDQMKAAVEGLKISIGQGLLPSLAESAKGFTEVIKAMDPAALQQFGRDLGTTFTLIASALGLVVKAADAIPGVHWILEYRAAAAVVEGKTKDWATATVELDKAFKDLKARSDGMDLAGQRSQVDQTTASVLKQALAWNANTEAQLENAVAAANAARITLGGAWMGGASVELETPASRAADAKVRKLTALQEVYRKKVQETWDLLKAQSRLRATEAQGGAQVDKKSPGEDLSAKAENARAEIEKSIKLKETDAASTHRLAEAELQGGLAVREATILKEQDRAVEEARLRAEKAKLAFLPIWGVQIKAAIRDQHDATLEQQRNAAEMAHGIEVSHFAAEAAARMTDAYEGNGNASRVLGAIYREEARQRGLLNLELKDGKEQLDETGRKAVTAAGDEERLKIATEARAKIVSDGTAADQRSAAGVAALSDALNDSTVATDANARQVAIDNAVRAAGNAISEDEIAALERKTGAAFDNDLALRHQKDTEKELLEIRRQTKATGAAAADWRQQSEAARTYGSDIAGILQGFGLLNDATRRHEIHEKARASAIDANNAAEVAGIEERLNGEDAVLRAAQAAAAQEQIAALGAQTVADAWKSAGQSILGSINDVLVTGKADWESLAQSLERSLLKTIEKVLEQYLEAEALKQAAAIRTAAIQSASSSASSANASTSGGSTGGAVSGASSETAIAALYKYVGVAGLIFTVAALMVNNYSKAFPKSWGTIDIGKPGQVPNRYGYGDSPAGINASVAVGGDVSLGAMQQRADQFVKALRQMVDGIGATLDDLAKIGIKKAGRGGNTHWRVYGPDGKMLKDFGTDEAGAMNFALITALKGATLGNASPLVQAAIKGSTATTADQLNSDIEFLRNLERSVMDEGEAWATQRQEQLRSERQRLEELVGATTEFGNAVRMLDAAYAKDVAARRNAALGIQESEQQRLARQAEEFNRSLPGLMKPLQDELAALLAQLAHAAQGPGAPGGSGGGGPLSPSGRTIPTNYEMLSGVFSGGADEAGRALAALGGAIGTFGQGALQAAAGMALAAATTGQSADEIARRIAELQALLQSAAFTPISPEEIARAGRGDGSAAAARKEALQGFRDKLAQMREAAGGSDVASIFGDLTRSIRDLRAEGKKAGASQAELAEGERLLREQAQKTIKARIDQLTGKGPSEYQSQLADGLAFFHDLIAKEQAALGGKVLREGPTPHAGEQQAFLARMRDDLSAAIMDFAGLTDPMTAVNLKAAQMRADLTALAAAGGISAEELARLTGVIDAGTEAARQRAVVERDTANNNLLLQLYGFLNASHQNAALELQLKQRGVDLQFLALKAQLIAAGIWAENVALFDQAHADALAAVAESIAAGAGSVNDAAGALSSAADAVTSALDALRQFRDSLRLDSQLSPLTSAQRLGVAQSDFQGLIAPFLSHNVDAMQRFPDVARAYLQELQGYSGRGGLYSQQFAYVQHLLDSVLGPGGTQQDPVVHAINYGFGVQHSDLEAIRTTLVTWGPHGPTTTTTGPAGTGTVVTFPQPWTPTPGNPLPTPIPVYGYGGIAMHDQIARVGDRGPEAIIPLERGFVPVIINNANSAPLGVDNLAEVLQFGFRQQSEDSRAMRAQLAELTKKVERGHQNMQLWMASTPAGRRRERKTS